MLFCFVDCHLVFRLPPARAAQRPAFRSHGTQVFTSIFVCVFHFSQSLLSAIAIESTSIVDQQRTIDVNRCQWQRRLSTMQTTQTVFSLFLFLSLKSRNSYVNNIFRIDVLKFDCQTVRCVYSAKHARWQHSRVTK
jgi:hypothetical protein